MINLEIIKSSIPNLINGAGVTLTIALFASLIGFLGGTILGIAQTSKSNILKIAVNIYVTIIRGTPMLIQIVFLYILLPQLGINLPKFTVAVIAIGINSAAYISQIVRSGIMSVSKGQIEAAKTLGLSKIDLMRFIILPQALSIVVPALGNELITLIKDSSLASIIGVTELYMEGTIIRNQTYDALSAYTAVAATYLILTSSLTFMVHGIEKYFSHHARN
jgi:arginine/lysine/histidine transport system permease protein